MGAQGCITERVQKRNRRLVVPKVNKYDQEDCNACDELQDLCLYHEGWLAGQTAAFDLIKRVADDPEIVMQPPAPAPAAP